MKADANLASFKFDCVTDFTKTFGPAAALMVGWCK